MGGSHYHLVCGISGGEAPTVDLSLAPRIFQRLYAAITKALVRSCHDLSEGGLAVAVAEMAFAGNVGADVTNGGAILTESGDDVRLFSETASRFLVEVSANDLPAFRDCIGDVPHFQIGITCAAAFANRRLEWRVDHLAPACHVETGVAKDTPLVGRNPRTAVCGVGGDCDVHSLWTDFHKKPVNSSISR